MAKQRRADESRTAAPTTSSFPTADGTLENLVAKAQPVDDLVVAPARADFIVGKNRFAFGVFNVDGTQIDRLRRRRLHRPRAPRQGRGPVPGNASRASPPSPPSRPQTTSTDPDAAKTVYVIDIADLDQPGEWRVVALVNRDGDSG